MYREKDDELFYADELIGYLLKVLSIIGVFCTVMVVCFLLGYLT